MTMAAPWSSSCCAGATTSAPRVVARAAGVRCQRLRWAASSGGSVRSWRQPGRKKRQHVSISATAAPPPPVDYADAGAGAGAGTADVASLKIKLLSAVSGLNRGLAASQEDLDRADAAARELEAVGGGPVDLNRDLDKLQGRWRLLYSSAFSSRTSGINITFEKTTVKTKGNLSQLPPLEVPRIPDNLRPPSNTGSGEFEVTYLDDDTRITRGDRGELRVFVIS
ncbi:hypothetical protein PR202_gb12987 [Eleusine coracana subsp. coracana]|uniref:Plastid lipid-associated protein/fibrillin conserved domain-containing protein n=1 Tax=Eleusine coracana subsp. coracana TaxID=191504 RepID=A0AAV5ERP2_ELECO|nr:hypothetical protein PR202_gb12987 [Eleusine coracana subsp. coracana]